MLNLFLEVLKLARATLSGWFKENPLAFRATISWLEDKKEEKATDSLATFVLFLKTKHAFPFNQSTTLQRWLIAHHSELYAAAITRKEVKAKRAATETFARSGSDLAKLSTREDFLVTSAVNNCAADPGFLSALERWREERGGALVVNPIKYKNPTRREEEDKDRPDRWWDRNLHPYLLEEELRPHPMLSLMTTKAQATVANPLPARLDGRTKGRSAIFGHPQLAMRSVATPQNDLAKLLYSSGAVTAPSYSDTIAGDMGEFHHSNAGVIAEVRGDRFHLREVVWDGECFIDLDRAYYADRIEDAPSPSALVMGDIHVGETAENVMEATFGQYGMVPVLTPERVVLHDLGNGTSVSPHEVNSRLTRAAQARRGETSLQKELDSIAKWLYELPHGPTYHVIPSNHDEFLDRWLEKGETGVESENLALYHELAAAMLREEAATGDFPAALDLALQHHTRLGVPLDVNFHKLDAPFIVEGVELGMHGNRGSNGARGSAAGFARLGVRSMVGHSHSPTIWQGCYVVGTSSNYRLSYNKGPSSWFQTHGLVHANGRRQLVHMIDDAWHG
jgi:hypothetical protein